MSLRYIVHDIFFGQNAVIDRARVVDIEYMVHVLGQIGYM